MFNTSWIAGLTWRIRIGRKHTTRAFHDLCHLLFHTVARLLSITARGTPVFPEDGFNRLCRIVRSLPIHNCCTVATGQHRDHPEFAELAFCMRMLWRLCSGRKESSRRAGVFTAGDQVTLHHITDEIGFQGSKPAGSALAFVHLSAATRALIHSYLDTAW